MALNVYQAAARQRLLLLQGEADTTKLFRDRWLSARVPIEAELAQVIANIDRVIALKKTPGFGRESKTTFSKSWLYETGRLGALLDQIDHQTRLFEIGRAHV